MQSNHRVFLLGLLTAAVLAAAPSPGHAVPLFQAAGNNFQQTNPDGLVVMEAESFQGNTSQGGHNWTATTAFAGFAGTGAMEVTPDNGGGQDTAFAANSPRLDFTVNFIATGTHYVWVRGWGKDGNSDSVHVGLDGAEIATSDRITGFGANFSWHKNTMDNVDATITVATTGVHTINVWMREDGFVCDRILLTTTAGYVPANPGPAESAQVAPPTGLVATAGYNQITLTWTAAAGANSYIVYRRDPSSATPAVFQNIGTPTGTTFVDNTARYPTSYDYYVVAVKNGVQSAPTATVSRQPLQPPISVTATALTTDENLATATFNIQLNLALAAGSTINFTVASSVGTEGQVSGSTQPMAATISFPLNGPAAAGTVIPITVHGQNDFQVDPPAGPNYTVAVTFVPVGPFTGFTVPAIQCTNLDNDTRGVTISQTAGIQTSEVGGIAQFTVRLTTQPTGNVTIGLVSSDIGEGTLSSGGVTFTTGNWMTPQTVTVTGVDDGILDFAVPYTIVTTASSTDPGYNGLAVPDISCVNLDNEVPPELPEVWGSSGCGLLGLEAGLLALVLRRRRRT